MGANLASIKSVFWFVYDTGFKCIQYFVVGRLAGWYRPGPLPRAPTTKWLYDVENIVALSRRDLQDIGIVSASEQKHLIEQARILHAAKSRPVGYSQRCEMSLERGTIIGV